VAAGLCRQRLRCQRHLWPFTDGSGLNARYNGDPVYQFQWNNDDLYCADESAFNPAIQEGPVELQQCGSPALFRQDFVYSGSDYLSPVYADNAEYAYGGTGDLPILVGDGYEDSDANGQPIYMDDYYELQWSIQCESSC
jgi:hypothetical protein